MKKRLLIATIMLCFTCGILSSYVHGPAYEAGINRTGSQGGITSCNGTGCHAPNTATTITAVIITTTSGAVITSYEPGATYAVTTMGHNTASISVSEFGFQLSAVLSSTLQAGSFSVPTGTNMRVVPLDGLQIVEHKNPMPDSVTDYAVAHFSWTAPVTGSGTVRFYGIINMLNDDDGDVESQSFPNTSAVIALTENNGTGISTIATGNKLMLYPNPCKDILHVTPQAGTANYSIHIYTLSGTLIYTGNNTKHEINVPTTDWQAGVYYATCTTNDVQTVVAIVKE